MVVDNNIDCSTISNSKAVAITMQVAVVVAEEMLLSVVKNNSFLFYSYGMILLGRERFILGIVSFFVHGYNDRFYTMTVNFCLELICIVLHTYYSIYVFMT